MSNVADILLISHHVIFPKKVFRDGVTFHCLMQTNPTSAPKPTDPDWPGQFVVLLALLAVCAGLKSLLF